MTLTALSLNGSSIEANLSDAQSVLEVRHRIASILKKSVGKVKLIAGDRMIIDNDELGDLGAAFTVLIDGNTYAHEGKDVKLVAGTMADHGCCTVYYADGSEKEYSGYTYLDSLVDQSGFVKYTSYGLDPRCCAIYECFEAVPPNDPSEWEEFEQSFELHGETRASGISSWRRKGSTKGAGAFLNRR